MEYLDARLAGRRAKFPLPLRRPCELKIVWENSMPHFDDKVWPRKKQKAKSPSDIEITAKPTALVILQPTRAEHKSARYETESGQRRGCWIQTANAFFRLKS